MKTDDVMGAFLSGTVYIVLGVLFLLVAEYAATLL